jgi:hypothetical protein
VSAQQIRPQALQHQGDAAMVVALKQAGARARTPA